MAPSKAAWNRACDDPQRFLAAASLPGCHGARETLQAALFAARLPGSELNIFGDCRSTITSSPPHSSTFLQTGKLSKAECVVARSCHWRAARGRGGKYSFRHLLCGGGSRVRQILLGIYSSIVSADKFAKPPRERLWSELGERVSGTVPLAGLVVFGPACHHGIFGGGLSPDRPKSANVFRFQLLASRLATWLEIPKPNDVGSFRP